MRVVPLLLVLGACAAPPPPAPDVVQMDALVRSAPEPVVRSPELEPLWTRWNTAAAQLRAYASQSPCAASGPIECADPAKAARADDAEQHAWRAMQAAEKARVVTPVARTLVRDFVALVARLPGSTTTGE